MDDCKRCKLQTHSVNATDLHLLKQYRNYGSVKSGNKRVFCMQNDQTYFFSDIFLKFYNIIKIII
jgi:hypothetical protein